MVQSYSPGCANVPSHVGTVAPPGEYDWTCASFGIPESTTQTANQSVQLLLHSSPQNVPVLSNGRPFPPKLPHFMRGSRPHLIYDSLGHSEPTIQMPLPPSKLPLPMGDLDPIRYRFPGPTRVLNPNSISIGSPVFSGLTTSVTDRLTHRPRYSADKNRPHLCM